MVVPWCLVGEQCTFCIRCICNLGQKRIVRKAWAVSHFLRVLVHICVGVARLSGHNLESGVGRC